MVWFMVIIKHPSLSRKYRTKRKRRAISPIEPKKRFLALNTAIMAIAFGCIALAIPLLLIASPFVLCAVGLLLIANACNEVRND
jgi:hypothetical protein